MRSAPNLLERLDACAGGDPNAISIVECGGAKVRRQPLLARAVAISRGFRAAGLQPGDAVLVAVRPSIAFVALTLGIHDSGGVIVPADPGMGDELFLARMATLNPKWVVAESVLLAACANNFVRRLLRKRGINIPPIASLRGAKFVRVGPRYPGCSGAKPLQALEQLVPAPAARETSPVPKGDAPGFIAFTSGTTGAPRAVVHSRNGLEAILSIVGATIGFKCSDVVYARDLHLIIPALLSGATVVIPPRTAFSSTRLLRDLNCYGVTHIFAVPAEYQALIDLIGGRGGKLPSTIRLLLIGSAPAHTQFLRRLRAYLPPNATAWVVYGMTEIFPVSFVTLEEKLAYDGAGDLVGRCMPGVQARISEEGELFLQGSNLFIGYLGEPSVAEQASGDLARLDEGRIVLLGRRKDMIIRGNYNIYPELYEPTIERIGGVRRCALIGVYDERRADEQVVLFVEPEQGGTLTSDRLRKELAEGPWRIDNSAQPDAVYFMKLPQSGRSRKIDKQALREIARARASCA